MRSFFLSFFMFISISCSAENYSTEGLPLYYYQDSRFVNFGDYLSLKLVERIVGGEVKVCNSHQEKKQKMLAIGSILILARTGDVLWGTGMNGKRMDISKYKFTSLDIKAVRGPLTRQFLKESLNIDCPEVYGDPALLLPYFFPEFKKKEFPEYDYIIIPHYSEIELYPKSKYPHAVYPTEPWRDVIRKILNSQFVISSSLHGLIVAEAYGIPAKYLRVSDYEPIYKYQDYYLGTNRSSFQYATSVEQALKMGGEPPAKCDLKKLYESFPFEYWPNHQFIRPKF